MFFIGHNFEIINIVINFVVVFMMNYFIMSKFSPKMLFHDISMLINLPSVSANQSISMASHSSVLPSWIIFSRIINLKPLFFTFHRAGNVFIALQFDWRFPNKFIADYTIYIFPMFSKLISSYSHFKFLLNKIGRAVVDEAEASQHAQKWKNLGSFVNGYSIA